MPTHERRLCVFMYVNSDEYNIVAKLSLACNINIIILNNTMIRFTRFSDSDRYADPCMIFERDVLVQLVIGVVQHAFGTDQFDQSNIIFVRESVDVRHIDAWGAWGYL